MSAFDSLKNRGGTFVAGILSFIVLIVAMRMSSGEPLFQPSADVGILLGVVLVGLFFIFSDANASKSGPAKGRTKRS